MTHEFKAIVNAYIKAKQQGISCVLATVVALEGSSYRRPGVRMLLQADGKRVGAVSGGCVEKEIEVQAQSVFKTGTAKVITYDGRYRLGCEGILYVLLEPFHPTEAFLDAFERVLNNRKEFIAKSYFEPTHGENSSFGTEVLLFNTAYSLAEKKLPLESSEYFEQNYPPCFQLVVIGGEHDAVNLCQYANLTGWEVTVVVDPREDKQLSDFPGATHYIAADGAHLSLAVDQNTAIVLMTHSYTKDLAYLLALLETNPAYLGLLGPTKRRNNLLNDVLERVPDVNPSFLELIKGPAGLDIGSETPQEICIAVMAEILSVIRNRDAQPLANKAGSIHV
ncbi:XdhC family protein [Croceivirga sp. JEA036]|uniref:XdhC family protein n=1 Tax=Croceivirga sp. JEA036 TaxID=2721162 RepID=UPI0014387FC3|nr:XdhC family protein [Croceivirga sp. JEA036]NJB35639.1 XdhC family protein [Croceivirga sp. JEA036]